MPSAAGQPDLSAIPLNVPPPPEPTPHTSRSRSEVVGLRVSRDAQRWWKQATTLAGVTYDLPDGLIPKVAMEFLIANFPEIMAECVRREYGVEVQVRQS